MIKKAFHIIFCIDTNSRNRRYLEIVKKRLINLNSFLHSVALEWDVELLEVNVKIIIYGSQANHIKESRWYNICDKKGLSNEYFLAFIRKIKIEETDEKSLGLEALSRAINSDWLPIQHRNTKQIVFLHSDSASNEIDEKRFYEVSESWMCSHGSSNLEQRNKRLILYTPDVYLWVDIYQSLNQVCFAPITLDNEVEYYDIIRPLLYNSL